jgi:hypothetical protein
MEGDAACILFGLIFWRATELGWKQIQLTHIVIFVSRQAQNHAIEPNHIFALFL